MCSGCRPFSIRLLPLAALFLFAIGCETTLEPFAEETGAYSIYGYLSVHAEEHHIRVKDLNAPPLAGESTLDATVTLTNLETGETETLADSLVAFDGLFTHNFAARLDVGPGESYAVTVEGDDGQTARATATTPEVAETVLQPGKSVQCHLPMGFGFPEISNPRFIDPAIGVAYGGEVHWKKPTLHARGSDGRGLFHGFKPSTVVKELLPPGVLPIARCDPERYCNLLDDKKIRIAYTHFGPDWPADSTFANPVASTVENGLGVFGGLRRDTLVAFTNADLRCPGPETVPCKPLEPPLPPPECLTTNSSFSTSD